MCSEPQQAQDIDGLLHGTPYRATRRLGAGGMGEIYEASGPRAGGTVVVKVLRADIAQQADMIDRMRVEGEALELLSHPNIVVAHGHGLTSDGRPYVAMEKLDGSTLQQEVRRRGALPVIEAIDYTRQLLSALRAVHQAGFVHRDVKPENLIVCHVGGRALIKLIDFGVAKVGGAPRCPIAPLAFPTLEGACIGTPRYASPEQARGDQVDPRTDIYAAGIVLYTLIAGRGPFDEIKGAGRVLEAHRTEKPPPLSQFTPVPIPPALESIVMRAIAKDPDDRFADAVSFSRELVVTMGRLCLPLASLVRRAELETAATEPRIFASLDPLATVAAAPRVLQATPSDARVTVVAPRFDEVPTVVHPAASTDATPVMNGAAIPSPVAPMLAPISRGEVLLSAAAFATVAGGLAMWFVR
jgi:serine/threonine-protein kinase